MARKGPTPETIRAKLGRAVRPAGKRVGVPDRDGTIRGPKQAKFDADGNEIVAPNERNKFGRQRRFTDAQVADALRRSAGLYTQAAQLLTQTYNLPCNRVMIQRAVMRSPWLQQQIREIEEAALDFAEGWLWQHIKAGSERSIHYYLSRKGARRGYTQKQEVSGPDGNAVPLSVDWASMPTDALLAVLNAAAPATSK